MEHTESLVKGYFDEDLDLAMPRSEWEAIAEDSAKKTSDALELLRLKYDSRRRMRASFELKPRRSPLQIMGHAAPSSPIDDVFGALGGEMDEATPDVPAEVCLYIWKLLTR